jgi:hypothetical protein
MHTGSGLRFGAMAALGRVHGGMHTRGRGSLTFAGFLLAATPVVLVAQGTATPPPSGGGGGDNHLDLGIGVHTGTLGFGAEVSKLVFGHLGVRAGFNYFDFSLNHSFDDVEYSAKLRMQTVPLLVDVFPSARGALHLTGGVVLNQTQFTGTAVPDPSGTITINHDSYTSAQVGVLNAAIKYPSSNGYVGFGIGTPARHSLFSGTLDVGAILAKPRVSLGATGAATNPGLASDLAAQHATTQTSVNKLSVYPVISSGVMLRF